MNIIELSGKRLLVKENTSSINTLIEIKVLEVSPSKKYVKVEYITKSTSWVSAEHYIVIEILLDNLFVKLTNLF